MSILQFYAWKMRIYGKLENGSNWILGHYWSICSLGPPVKKRANLEVNLIRLIWPYILSSKIIPLKRKSSSANFKNQSNMRKVRFRFKNYNSAHVIGWFSRGPYNACLRSNGRHWQAIKITGIKMSNNLQNYASYAKNPPPTRLLKIF